MNPIQKAYESIDRTTIMLKRNQSYCHLRNLYQIRDKKTQVRLFNPKKAEHSKPTEFDIFKAKKIENDNEILRKKLIHLFCKSPKPQLNLDFLENTKKKIKMSEYIRKEIKTKIIKENSNMYKKLCSLKPFFNAKTNDKSFEKEHSELLNRIRKFPKGILPKITLPKVQIRLRKNASEGSIRNFGKDKNINNSHNSKEINKENDLFFTTSLKV